MDREIPEERLTWRTWDVRNGEGFRKGVRYKGGVRCVLNIQARNEGNKRLEH